MTTYFFLKFLHVVGTAALLGTGAGIAFFLLLAHRTGRASTVAAVARIVVIADFVFTATAVVVQPITGILLSMQLGIPLSERWIALSILLYLVTGAFWVPVVFMQIRIRDLATAAARSRCALCRPNIAGYSAVGLRFGFPAFGAVLAIIWLMIAKPTIQL